MKSVIDSSKQYLDNIRDAYKKAPYAGIGMGILQGLPYGLAAGGLTYGVLSLLPATRRKRMLKAITSLLAAGAADAYIAVPNSPLHRDEYFKNRTSLPSPWKTYKFKDEKGNPIDVNPNDVMNEAKDAWDNAKNNIATEWNKLKTAPAAYIASGIH